MLNLYRGRLLLPLPLRHMGENGSVAYQLVFGLLGY
jgi:hypothetical protein